MSSDSRPTVDRQSVMGSCSSYSYPFISNANISGPRRSVYSVDTQIRNAMALFSLYLYVIFTSIFTYNYFVVILYIFPEIINRIREPKQRFTLLFSFFFMFLSFHATQRLRGFSVRDYTFIPNNVSGFFMAGIHLPPLISQTRVFSSARNGPHSNKLY